jgi:hypothetical protein
MSNTFKIKDVPVYVKENIVGTELFLIDVGTEYKSVSLDTLKEFTDEGLEPLHKKTFANRAPLPTDDETQGYDVWSYFVDTRDPNEIYRCVDATEDNAV